MEIDCMHRLVFLLVALDFCSDFVPSVCLFLACVLSVVIGVLNALILRLLLILFCNKSNKGIYRVRWFCLYKLHSVQYVICP